MKQQKKFQSEQQQEHAAEHHTGQTAGREFASVDDLLRFDAAHTTTPPAIADRLQKSSAQIPKPSSPSWWQRFFK
jgi:hypothetical protein